MKKQTIVLSTAIIFCLLLITIATALNNQQRNLPLALGGYDVVTYFHNDTPKPGMPDYFVDHAGQRWRFVDETNMLEFKANPNRFMPQFNGNCAYALATEGKFMPGHPALYRISGGNLYLFHDRTSMALWNRNFERFIDKANVYLKASNSK